SSRSDPDGRRAAWASASSLDRQRWRARRQRAVAARRPWMRWPGRTGRARSSVSWGDPNPEPHVEIVRHPRKDSGPRDWALAIIRAPLRDEMRHHFRVVGVIALSLQLSSTLYAHHSFAAQYDSSKPVEMRGTVTKVEWTNPHARVYIDVRDDKGQIANW